jgi:hypothetical protein
MRWLSEDWKFFLGPKHLQVAFILFSHKLLTREQGTRVFFGLHQLICAKRLTDLTVALGAALTDADHLTGGIGEPVTRHWNPL